MRYASALAIITMLAAAPPAPCAPPPANWPRLVSPHRLDPAMEARIGRIIASMSLEQKIGQMTQADIHAITPDQVRTFAIGSVLNGGGGWPAMNKDAPASQWAALSDAYYKASMATGLSDPVPVIWGIDAVHGNNNVRGATIYPHNIGLGAAHDPALVGAIAHATARAVRATGITWAFAPTLAVAQNQRWGRSYESYSADPALVRRLAQSFVRAMQGDLHGQGTVLATAKHFIGDGATFEGQDQGDTRISQARLIATHAQGYFGALGAGVQTVMASYSSWNGTKMHAQKALLSDALKGRMGFDGFVVSDWNAIEQVPGCTISHCPAAINAGIDMVMVPLDWQAFIANTVADVKAGTIPMARIDDAVRRIVRVKLRTGLFAHSPGVGGFAGDDGAMVNRALAARAVRESLVLLKNDGHVLPLARARRVLVVGKSADSFALQSGGWSRTWQGDGVTNADFSPGETLLAAVRRVVGADKVTYSETAQGIDPHKFDTIIAVIGETPYAEYKGDVRFPASLAHSARYPEDRKLLDAVSGKGVPVVTVLYSGRTVYANDLINRSDAFVAAWLPGSEAGAIADVLFRNKAGGLAHDFRGRLSFDWIGSPCAVPGSALFRAGYGLGYTTPRKLGHLAESVAPSPCGVAH